MNDTPCEAHGNGATRRNFIHVDDVSRALETIIDKGVIGETYNIGTNHEYAVLDIFQKLTKIMGKGNIKFVPDRPYNDSRYCIDSSALCSLGWREDDNFDSKLRDTVQWYQDHPDWYK